MDGYGCTGKEAYKASKQREEIEYGGYEDGNGRKNG